MSLVRYTNKKTGWVSIYESTSHYDPVSKKSRPIRKYLGYEDPATGAFVASSGKPGRKKKSAGKEGAAGNPRGKSEACVERSEVEKLREENRSLREEVNCLRKKLDEVHEAADKFMKEIHSI